MIILGSSVRGWSLSINKWIYRHASILADKKIIIFSVSGTSANDIDLIDDIMNSSIPDELIDKIKYFALPGAMNFENLSLIDKNVLRAGALIFDNPEIKSQMFESYNRIDKNSIKPIVLEIKKIMSNS